MRVSELVERSGVPLATVKYYIREGLLPPGRTTSTTRACYGEEHLRRLRLIKALTGVAGLPLARVREVVDAVDHPDRDLPSTLGRAVRALSAAPSPTGADAGSAAVASGSNPRAHAALEQVGQGFEPDYPAVAQLEAALAAAEQAGMPVTAERMAVYGSHVRAIAQEEVDALPEDAGLAAEQAVLGTILFEPVIAALRRVAHQDLAQRRDTRP